MSAVVEPTNVLTPNLGLNKPLVGGDDDVWGDLLNANADTLDSQITALHQQFGIAQIAAVPPPAASPGALWWDSADGQLYVRYDDGNSVQWVPASNLGALSGPLNYTATGTPAVRSAQDRAADWINVKDYGAKLDGTADDSAAFNAAYAAAVASLGNPTIYVPRGGINIPGFSGGTTKPILWRLEGNDLGTGTFPYTLLGDGDITQTFDGRVAFNKNLVNSTNTYAVVDIGLNNGSSASGSPFVPSALVVAATTQANVGAGAYTWPLNVQLYSHSMGGGDNQEVCIASSVRKYGAATTWQYYGQTTDHTGLGYPDNNGSIVIAEYDVQANGPENAITGFNPGFGSRGGIELVFTTPYQPPAWQASHAYVVGDVIQPTPANGFTYICTIAGTSGASHPAWPTSTGSVADGTATWRYGTTINYQVSRAIDIGSVDATAQLGAGMLTNAYFYDAILELSGAHLVDGGIKDAAIRLAADHPIDFSGNLTDAGQNLHTLRFSSSEQRLVYRAAGNERFSVADSGTVSIGGPPDFGYQLEIKGTNTVGIYTGGGTFTTGLRLGTGQHLGFRDDDASLVYFNSTKGLTFQWGGVDNISFDGSGAATFGPASSNALTITPGFAPTSPIVINQTGSGGFILNGPLRLTAAGIAAFIFTNLPVNAADDVGAAGLGIPVGGVYRNGSALQVRVS